MKSIYFLYNLNRPPHWTTHRANTSSDWFPFLHIEWSRQQHIVFMVSLPFRPY